MKLFPYYLLYRVDSELCILSIAINGLKAFFNQKLHKNQVNLRHFNFNLLNRFVSQLTPIVNQQFQIFEKELTFFKIQESLKAIIEYSIMYL